MPLTGAFATQPTVRQNARMTRSHQPVALLDSFGTLVRGSHQVPWIQRLIALATEFGVTIDETGAREAAVAALQFMNQHTLIRSAAEEQRMYLAYYARLLAGLGVRDRLEGRAAEVNHRFRVAECWLRPFDETASVLTALRAAGYRLAVVSDGFPSLRHDYRRMGLAEYFDAIVVAAELGAWKPAPRVYQAALDRLDATIDDCVYLDDTPDDAAGAAALGIRTYLMDRQEKFADSGLPRVASLCEFADRLGVAVHYSSSR